MRTHSQITAKLMRRPGVRDEVELLVGSANVYADLGYADAVGMQRKSQLAAEH